MANVTDRSHSFARHLLTGIVFDADPGVESAMGSALEHAKTDFVACSRAWIEGVRIAISREEQPESADTWVEDALKAAQLASGGGASIAACAATEALRDALRNWSDPQTAAQFKRLFKRIASYGSQFHASIGTTGRAHYRACERGWRASARAARAALTGITTVVASKTTGQQRIDAEIAIRSLATLDDIDPEIENDWEDPKVQAGLADLPGWPSWAMWQLARMDRLRSPVCGLADLLRDDDFSRNDEELAVAKSAEPQIGGPAPSPPDTRSVPKEPKEGTHEWLMLKALRDAPPGYYVTKADVPDVTNPDQAVDRLRPKGHRILSAKHDPKCLPGSKGHRLDNGS